MAKPSILLVNPPWNVLEDHIYHTVGNVLPPLGLAYIAAVLRDNGFKVEILDALALEMSGADYKQFLSKAQPDIVGITATTPAISRAWKTAEFTKEVLFGAKVLIGGPHATQLPEESLERPCIDIVVRGEAEYTMLELVKELSKEKPDLTRVKGISFKQNNKVIHNKDRPPIIDLDALPYPARDLLPMDKYHATPGNHRRDPATSMLTSRGCPFGCVYCSKPFGRKYRAHSVGYVLGEIEHIITNWPIKEIVFFDDTLTFDTKRMHELCGALIEKNWDLTWSCMARADGIDYGLAKKMKKSGCQYIGFGIESATPQLLKNLNKGETIETINKALRACKRAGLLVRGFYIIGTPGETEETLKRNLEHAKEMDLDLAQFSIITPYPGTPLFKWAEENNLLLTKDWDKYDCSEPVMRLPNFSAEELKAWYARSFKTFYARPFFIVRQAMKIRTKGDFVRYSSTFLALVSRWARDAVRGPANAS